MAVTVRRSSRQAIGSACSSRSTARFGKPSQATAAAYPRPLEPESFLSVYRAGRELLAGHLDDAERLGAEAAQIGGAHTNVLGAVALLLFEIRREQDRLPELLDFIRDFRVPPGHPGWALDVTARRAVAQLAAGDPDDARRALEAVIAGLRAIRDDPGAPGMTIAACVESLAAVAPDEVVEDAYRLARRWSGYWNVWSGAVCMGPADLMLMQLALRLGRFDVAARHYQLAQVALAPVEAPSLHARLHVAGARLALACRDPDRARAEIAKGEEAIGTLDLPLSRRLLEEADAAISVSC